LTNTEPMAGTTPAAGTLIENRYIVQRFMAQGGVADIYAAAHRLTGREVALKLPNPTRARDSVTRERLNREATVLARARHPGVVEILDAGEYQSAPYLVLERMEGRTLGGWLAARGRFPWLEAARMGLRLAEILAHCHRVGVVHRDLKPDNVFIELGPTGGMKLFDFGIARVTAEGDDELNKKLTQEGTIIGTPEYMAPEALLLRPTDHRLDVYGLGVVLFELMSGVVPYEGQYPDLVVQATSGPTRLLSRVQADVPEAMSDVVRRCLEKEPDARFGSMAELAAALAPLVFHEPSSRAMNPRPAPPVKVPVPAAPPKAPDTQESRRFPRAPYTTPAKLTLGDGSVLDGRIEELSEGGTQFIAERGIASGERVECRFGLPISGKICQVQATSRWTRGARANRHATGFEFEGLNDDAAAVIRHYVTLMGGS
jgi:eukaryotic-like serine/threonine-protein kinase